MSDTKVEGLLWEEAEAAAKSFYTDSVHTGKERHAREYAYAMGYYRGRRAEPPASTAAAQTGTARFCQANGDDGCKDSWHVGGNYGSAVCTNPAHHKQQTKE